jgi:hypothetical protein
MTLFPALAAVAALAFQEPTALAAPPGSSSSAPASGRALAVRTMDPVVIDGRNTESVWRTSPTNADFRQFEPRANAQPSLRTEFQVAYDERNLYVYVRAHDPHPDSIMRALTRRDVRGPSDQIKVLIDAYHDRRSGFEFAVNPAGVKRDWAVANDDDEDSSWNGVWDVATVVDSLGWAAEYQIPLSQLRFPAAARHAFGLGIWRDIERYPERVSWPLFTIERNGMMSQLGDLEGLVGIGSGSRLELSPYVVTRNISRAADTGGFDRVQEITAGADVKYGITPNLTLDATINPDFGQVEADPAVLNLSAFETFLGERRPFFSEGTGFYRFELNCYIVVDCSTNEGLFYSRRIGRTPTLRNEYGDATTPSSTPIAAAAKLTGRTAGGLTFGAMNAFTPEVDGANQATVEPRTNYAVLRMEQDLNNGEAGIGWIATGVNRALDEWTAPVLHSSAYVTGLSARSRFGSGNYEVNGSFTASRVAGSAEAVLRTQRGPVHYYQQPGGAALDSTRTALTGTAAQFKVGKYGGGITRFETSLVRHSPGYDPNDLGFLRRADILDWSTWGALSFRTPRGIYRWLQLNANHWEHWNTAGLRLDNALNVNGHMGLSNNWNVHAGGTVRRLSESYCDRCSRGGPPLRSSGGFFPWFGVNGDSRKPLVPSLWLNLGYSDEGQSRSVSLNPSLTVRVSSQFEAQLGANIEKSEDHTQWYDNFTDASSGVTHYAFAHLEQRTASMSVRLNYVVSPDLSVEFYGEPFVSTGRWSEIRELSSTPGAKRYEDRFQPYAPPAGSPEAFRFGQVRTNTVLRWEYRPGSTLFVVWAHGRQESSDERSDRALLREYRELFEQHPDNTFLVKVAYWLNR